MDLQINQAKVNTAKNQQKKEIPAKKSEQTEQRPQMKEHCSSKAAKAIRGAALGLALAAGVAIGSKAAPVQAANTPITDNTTGITQQEDTNVEKTDVEMMVDELMNSEQTASKIYAGRMTDCTGEMTSGNRLYETADISKDGTLTFYDKETHTRAVPYHYIDAKGHSHSGIRTETYYTYNTQNSFALGTKVDEDRSINLTAGSRFEETAEKNGDYVELAEDGKTFIVFDSEGNQIGSCTMQTLEEHKQAVKTGLTIGLIAGGATAAITCGYIASEEKRH